MIEVVEMALLATASATPLLCLDTSALLDLMRDPTRERFSSDHAAAGMSLLPRAEASGLMIILTKQVLAELDDHIDAVQIECKQAIDRLDLTLGRVLKLFAAHGAVPSGELPKLATLEFPNKARSLVTSYRKVATVVNEGEDVVSRAWNRVATAKAPGASGKQSMKDCVIVENYLEIARQLRAKGSTQTVVFLSTNTEDYTVKRKLHPDLTGDFGGVRLDFAVNFSMARSLIFPNRSASQTPGVAVPSG
jgi:hypothetical protein